MYSPTPVLPPPMPVFLVLRLDRVDPVLLVVLVLGLDLVDSGLPVPAVSDVAFPDGVPRA